MRFYPARMVREIQCDELVLTKRFPPEVHPFSKSLAHLQDAPFLGVLLGLKCRASFDCCEAVVRQAGMLVDCSPRLALAFC